MHITWGGTRFVVLIGEFAIKFPLLRPGRWIKRFYYWHQQRKVREKLMTFHSIPLLGAYRYLFGGAIANLCEVRMWKEHPYLPLAPTLFSFFGLMNIQVRGRPIQENELNLCPFQKEARQYPELNDFARAEHFAWIDGRICFVDYGNEEVAKIIVQQYGRELALVTS